MLTDPKIRQELDNYSEEVKKLYQKIWEDEVNKGMWRIARDDYRRKKAGLEVD